MRQDFNHKKPVEQTIQIFLDMDGVISDFDGYCDKSGRRLADGSPDYQGMNQSDWYKNMCVFAGARSFYDALCTRGRVRILTAPIRFTGAFSGKAKWLKKFIPEKGDFILADLMVVASCDKQLVAAPGRILIDDSKKNIDEWNAAGGIGILHQGDYAATLKHVDDALAGINHSVRNLKHNKKQP